MVYFYRNTLPMNCIVHFFVLLVPPQRLPSSQSKPPKRSILFYVWSVFRGRITQILVLSLDISVDLFFTGGFVGSERDIDVVGGTVGEDEKCR